MMMVAGVLGFPLQSDQFVKIKCLHFPISKLWWEFSMYVLSKIDLKGGMVSFTTP